MSRDIRTFFQLKKTPKPTVEDDDDVIPESPDVQITKPKKKDVKRRAIIKDDSDEEIFSTKKKTNNTQATNKIKSPKPALKEVKVVDMFGNEPIKRTKPLINKKKKTELGIHSDDEFEKSLLEIDNEQLESNEEASSSKIKEEKQSPTVQTDSNKTDKTPSKKKNKNNNLELNKESETSKTPSRNDGTESKTSKTNKNNQTVSNSNNSSKKSKMEYSKRKFAEFLEDGDPDLSNKKKKLNESKTKSEEIDEDMDSSFIDDSDDKNKNKKKKFNKSLNESVLTDEERHERKMHSAALYKSYLNRSGPKNLGAKEIPEGKHDCLKDCAFVLTGVLDSFEKDEITAAINQYGGVVKSGVTKKVTHVLAGEDGGPAKMAKAEELGIPIINEDQFLKMITDRSQGKPTKSESKKEIKKEKSPVKKVSKDKLSPKDKSVKDTDNHVENKTKKSPMDKIKTESKSTTSISRSKLDVNESKNHDKVKSPKNIKEEKVGIKVEPSSSKASSQVSRTTTEFTEHPANASMWVEKYKPQNIKQIIGQHGDASNVKKLMNWLTKWYVNRQAKLPKPNPYAHNDDGGYYKAVLLSGPPGVGKTTTVSLVCKEMGFDMVEFNASDTRNKTLIKEQIGELLNMTSLSGYAHGQVGKQALSKKHVLVMDEVDGMAGNEDRGGLQELIGLIKTTSVPIICMCNDRNSQKMRSLVNYCYDLRFQRPKLEQIKAAMLSICCKEGVRIPADALSQLIVSAGHDVRQTLNLLSLWAAGASDPDTLRADAKVARKDFRLGPWDVIEKVFSAEEHKTMSISDKSDLFFFDYSLGPLFVQENYLTVEPRCPKHETLQRISRAADSISLGDLVESKIRRSQAWSLLPTQAILSSVIPGFEMSGQKKGRTQFPGWLGKNSRATKFQRLCQEIHAHTRLSTSGSKSSIFLDYSSHIRDAIVNPLIKDKLDGVTKSLEVLESYHLLREDLDSLVELSLWPGKRDPTALIDSKVKAAMTRTYNKNARALPYAQAAVKRGKPKADDELAGEDEAEAEAEDDEPPDSDPENDALIKKKKTKETDKPKATKSQTKAKPSTSKKKKEK